MSPTSPILACSCDELSMHLGSSLLKKTLPLVAASVQPCFTPT